LSVGISICIFFIIVVFSEKTNIQLYYAPVLFLATITFIVIRQYTNAKQLRIEASNRVAMAQMFEKIENSGSDKYDDFIPKIMDSVVYSMQKDNKDMAIPEQIKVLKDQVKTLKDLIPKNK
jgi:hypothetical protein